MTVGIADRVVRLRIVSDATPHFAPCEGLDFWSHVWTPVDLATLTDEQRGVIETYVGRLLWVHPEDGGRLAEAGYQLTVDGRLERTHAATASPPGGAT